MSLNDNYVPLKFRANADQKLFPVTWNVNDAATIIVATYTAKDELIRTYVAGTDYVYTPNAQPGIGGSVTTTVAPAAGEVLVITRDEPYTQWLELLNSGRLDLVSLEKTLDHLMMCIQQNRDEAARSIKVPPSSEEPPELLAILIFEARDQAIASAASAKNSEANALASKVSAAESAAEAAATLAAAKIVIATDLDGAQKAIAKDRTEAQAAISKDRTAAQGAIATDKAGAQAAILKDKNDAQTAISKDRIAAQSAISTDKSSALSQIAADKKDAVDKIAADKAGALSAIKYDKDAAITSIAQIGAVNVNAVQAAGSALLANAQDGLDRITAEGTAQIAKVAKTGSDARIDVVLEGDRQVDRVSEVGARFVQQTYDEAQRATGEADRAEAAADNAVNLTGYNLASAAAVGLCPRVGFGLKVQDQTLMLENPTIVVSNPQLSFPPDVAIGYKYNLSMSATTAIPGAGLAGFRVTVESEESFEVVADSEGHATTEITIDLEGIDLTSGAIAVQAVDTTGNKSNVASVTYIKHTVVIRAPRILSPLDGDVDVALKTPFQLQSFNSVGMPSNATSTRLQVATDEEFTDIVFDTGDMEPYKTDISLAAMLSDDVQHFARAAHKSDLYGWSEYGLVNGFVTIKKEIKKPRIISPAIGAVNQPVDLTVVISAIEVVGIDATPVNTQIIVSDTNGVTVVDTGESALYGTSVSIKDLPVNTALLVKARHKDTSLLWAEYSDAVQFTTLNAYTVTPTAVSPTGAMEYLPLFSFSPFENEGPIDTHATTKFQLARDRDMADIIDDVVISSGDKTKYQHVTPELANDTPYWVRVMYEGAKWGWSAWSAPRMLRTKLTSISNAVITSPINGALDQPIRLPLTLTEPKGSGDPLVKKRTEFVMTPPTATPVVAADGWVTSFTWPDELSITTNYTLSAKFTGEYGGYPTRVESAAAAVSFLTLNAFVQKASITGPANNATGLPLRPAFTFSPLANAGPADTGANTRFQLATDAGFTSLLVDTGDAGAYVTGYTHTADIAINTQLWARVKHRGAKWGWGIEWSDVWMGRTLNAYANKANITSPANGATGLPLRPTFTFEAFSNVGPTDAGANTHFQLSRDAGFTSLVADTTGGGAYIASFTVGADITIDTPLWARVRHRGAKWGWAAEWSNPWTGRTIAASLATPSIISPANGATNQPLRPTLTFSDPVVVGQTVTGMHVILHTVGVAGGDTYYNSGIIPYSKTHTLNKDLVRGKSYTCHISYMGSVTGQTPWWNGTTITVAAAFPGEIWYVPEAANTWTFTPPIPGATYEVYVLGAGGKGGWGGKTWLDGKLSLPATWGGEGKLGSSGGVGGLGASPNPETGNFALGGQGGQGGHGYRAIGRAVVNAPVIFEFFGEYSTVSAPFTLSALAGEYGGNGTDGFDTMQGLVGGNGGVGGAGGIGGVGGNGGNGRDIGGAGGAGGNGRKTTAADGTVYAGNGGNGGNGGGIGVGTANTVNIGKGGEGGRYNGNGGRGGDAGPGLNASGYEVFGNGGAGGLSGTFAYGGTGGNGGMAGGYCHGGNGGSASTQGGPYNLGGGVGGRGGDAKAAQSGGYQGKGGNGGAGAPGSVAGAAPNGITGGAGGNGTPQAVVEYTSRPYVKLISL